MAKSKKGSVGPPPKNSNDINSDLTGNGTFKGRIEPIIGTHRLADSGSRPIVAFFTRKAPKRRLFVFTMILMATALPAAAPAARGELTEDTEHPGY